MDLIGAVIENNEDCVFELLRNNADVHYCEDSEKMTPLHHAISTAKIEIIFLLIEFGAGPYAETAEEGDTPFQYAVNFKRFDVVSLFLNCKKSRVRH